MADEVLYAVLDENIQLQEVLTWIFDGTCGSSLQDKLGCSRGDFVLCFLNFLRQSTTRVWQQSTAFQSPLKPIIKSSNISSSNNHSPQHVPGERRPRRVELFPKDEREALSKSTNRRKDGIAFKAIKGNDHRVEEGVSPQSPLLEITGKPSKVISNDIGNPFLTSEVDFLATSSPCSISVTSNNTLHSTPLNKHVCSFKVTERQPPTALANSPDSQFKTPTRGNTLCLGDFIAKSSKSLNSKKRFSQSPPTSPPISSGNPNNEHLNNQSNKKKHRRRINPTKVFSPENALPPNGFEKPQVFGSATRPLPEVSPFQAPVSVDPVKASQSYSEERNLLKQERLKLLSQVDNSIVPIAPINSSQAILSKMVVKADPEKVTKLDQLLKICDIYCCVLDSNLVPNLMSELYFVVSLLIVRSDATFLETSDNVLDSRDSVQNTSLDKVDCEDSEEDNSGSPLKLKVTMRKKRDINQYFSSIHNCVFFATQVLLKQISVLGSLDRPTLKMLLDCERISVFAPALKENLILMYSANISKAKVSQSLVSSNVIASGNVSFQSDTDNSSNFPSAYCFSNFRKQRDGFYELLRIWEANHLKQGWCFTTTLGNRVRSLVHLCSDPVNLMHFARLFRLQLISTMNGGSNHEEGVEDLQFLEGLKGVDPDKLNRLRDRLVTSYKARGPRPAPSFPGPQEFYRDFIICSSHSSFIQHLQDSLISHILELDQTSFLASDTEDSDVTVDGTTRQNYLSCVITLRLLAKFLGLVVFLPYSRSETTPPQNIVETEVSVRAKVMPPLNIVKCVIDAHKTHRLVVTVPWVVKFLGMMDAVSCSLPVYHTVLRFLLRLYIALHGGNKSNFLGKKLSLPEPTILLLRLSLGWLFEASFIQDKFFYSWCFNMDESLLVLALDVGDTTEMDVSTATLDRSDLSITSNSQPPVDALNLVDSEVLYALCPFLSELKALLASTSSGSVPGASIRHITPVSTGSSQAPSTSSSKQIELKLEDSFFHGLPASVHRTVEFVVERVTSSCVKHICNEWLPGLKQKGILDLQEKIRSFQTETESESDTSVIQAKLKNEVSAIVDKVSHDLKEKCRSGVGDLCLSKCRGALMSLLPEESLGRCVCEMCISIASRMSEERVVMWMQNHATLTLYSKELQSEAEKTLKNHERVETLLLAKTSHIAPGANASWQHDDSAPSPFCVLQALKLMVGDILNGENVPRENVDNILNQMEQCVTKRQDVVPAAERILALLSVDLVVSLVCHNPRMLDSALQFRLISLWKLDALRPVEDGLARLVCPRNMLLLAQSHHPTRLVWEKLAEVVAAVLKANLVTADLVENQCLAIMQQEWPQSILRCFAMCMNEVVRQYQKQKDVDYKFVLLLEWLAETMAQM